MVDMFGLLKRRKKKHGAYAPPYRRHSSPPPPRPSGAKTPEYCAPPMPDTAPCKDGFKSVWFDENGGCHIVDDVYVTIGGVEYKVLGVERVDAISERKGDVG